ncbi:M20/M25/M40 family metallo-hydrolase [Massilistercora timonensis]|uniref:M20 metallopeptidase family protein n=1 Tax=Massilistercora timonensis TaxID=2086584 RepID=UPI003208B70A
MLIRGGKPGKTICIRHDMDALPIQEETGLPFQSEVDGVSHACGHDIHTAIALYCGRILNERKEELAGNVRIVFQPAEETGQGAREMMEAGFKKLSPANDIVVGLHTHPETPVGMISLREGPMEAGAGLSADPDPGKGLPRRPSISGRRSDPDGRHSL